MSPSSAVLEPAESRSGWDEDAIGDVLRRVLGAIYDFDQVRTESLLDEVSSGVDLERFIGEVAMPLLAELGARWERGEFTVAHEHFASHLVRNRLAALAVASSHPSGPSAVLACPPNERHDIPLLCLAVLLGAHGWQVRFLGGETPLPALAKACRFLEPTLVVLSATRVTAFESIATPLRHLARQWRVALGGPGATEALALDVQAQLLPADVVAAVRLLDEQAPATR